MRRIQRKHLKSVTMMDRIIRINNSHNVSQEFLTMTDNSISYALDNVRSSIPVLINHDCVHENDQKQD